MSKAYKDIRAHFAFDNAPKSDHQSSDEQFHSKPHASIKIDNQQPIKFEHHKQPNFDEETSYQKMFEICQQLNSDKALLINTVDSQKQQILELERQIAKIQSLQSIYQQESLNFKEEQLLYVREIETLQCQLQVLMTQRQEKVVPTDDLLYETLLNFINRENIQEVISVAESSNKNRTMQFIVEYLIDSYNQKRNQEEKYQSHIKDNIQIIYDLQNKIQDLTCNPFRLTTPKSQFSDTNKMSSSANNFNRINSTDNLDREELLSKINYLKHQGKEVNRKWQEFCENIIKERNEIIKHYKNYIEQINEQNQDLQKVVSEILQYLGQRQQELWIQLLDIKQQISLKIQDLSKCDNMSKPHIEAELKYLYQVQAQIKSNLNRNRPLTIQ